MNQTEQIIQRIVVEAIAQVAEDNGQVRADLAMDSPLKIDSMTVMQLAATLEDALGVDEFPMQEWLDEQAERERDGYTVGSLVGKCMAVWRVAKRPA